MFAILVKLAGRGRSNADGSLDLVVVSLEPSAGGVGQGCYRGLAWNHVHIDDMCPLDDTCSTASILQLNRVANITKFAVLKDEETMLAS
ncbi:hypothetical protein HG530_009046 [Fusarium avenaceum]|nr:hypothetical protein HG530_009046 [Fusarium avenaceum]